MVAATRKMSWLERVARLHVLFTTLETIARQAAELGYFTPMSFANPRAIELAQTLAELTPTGINNFLFVCDGSEAVESAMKLARQYHYDRGEKERFKVIARRGGYHGVTSLALRVAAISPS